MLTSTLMAAPALADDIYPPDPGEVITPPPPTNGIGQFHPTAPARILDTRFGIGGVSGRITGGTSKVVDVTVGDIPATGVSAVALNVTVTGPTAGGFLTLYPAGTARPTASNINYSVGQTIANMTVVKVGASGNVRVYASGTTHVIFDVVGWYHATTPQHGHVGATLFNALRPARVLDTRYGIGGVTGRIAGGTSRVIDVTGVGGVPGSGVAAVALNVTVTGSGQAGFLTIYPSGTARPTTSNINYAAGQTIANMSLVKVGSDGKVRVYADKTTHVIFDVVGWFAPNDPDAGGEMSPMTPTRILDTRYGIGGITGRIAGGTWKAVNILGVGGVPAKGVAAVKLNVTVTGATQGGYLTLYPSGTSRPTASNLNYASGQTIAAMAIAKVGSDGKIRVFAAGTTHVIFDVIGFYSVPGTEPNDSAGAAQVVVKGPTTTTGTPPTAAELAAAAPSEKFTVANPHKVSIEELASGQSTDQIGAQGASERGALHPDPVISSPLFVTDSAGYVGGDPRIGRIYFHEFTGESNWHFCTGTVVARNLVLTAGHCVADAATHTFFTDWYFIPGMNGSLSTQPYGSWTATDAVALDLYRVNGNSAADWGLLVFDSVPANGNQYIGNTTGWFNIHADPPGGTKLSYGYPGEGWFASNPNQTCSYDYCVMYTCTSRVNDSNTQYLLTLVDNAYTYGGWFEVGYGCWMTGGASGGPVFQQIDGSWWVTGVNSHIQTDSAGTFSCSLRPGGMCFSYARNMWSPYLNSAIITTWYDYYVP
jgi:hypothetical protein